MAYYTKVLQPDETVRAVGRLHWIIYWPALFWLLAAIAITWVGAFVAIEEPQRSYCFDAAIAIVVVAILMFVAGWLRRKTTEIVITDGRVLYKRGLLSRWTMEMNVAQIETVDVRQSIWGRILDYGTVIIRGTGASIEGLRAIAAPVALRNAILMR